MREELFFAKVSVYIKAGSIDAVQLALAKTSGFPGGKEAKETGKESTSLCIAA